MIWKIHFVVLTVFSLVTFAIYGWDKWSARRAGRRVSERTLHALTWAGGWPGALAGRRLFRHKTRKSTFLWQIWLAMVAHGVVAILTWGLW